MSGVHRQSQQHIEVIEIEDDDDDIENTAAELADEVLQAGTNNPDRPNLFNRVGSFFFKMKHCSSEESTHWWCRYRLPELSCFMLRLMDKRVHGNHVDLWMKESERQLSLCKDWYEDI